MINYSTILLIMGYLGENTCSNSWNEGELSQCGHTDEEVTVYPSQKGWREKQSFIGWYWKPVKVIMCFSCYKAFFLLFFCSESIICLSTALDKSGHFFLLIFPNTSHLSPHLYSSEPILGPKVQYYTWEVTVTWPKDIINHCIQKFQLRAVDVSIHTIYHICSIFTKNYLWKWMESKMNDCPSPSSSWMDALNVEL